MGAGAEALLGRVEGALSQGAGAGTGAVYAAARRRAKHQAPTGLRAHAYRCTRSLGRRAEQAR